MSGFELIKLKFEEKAQFLDALTNQQTNMQLIKLTVSLRDCYETNWMPLREGYLYSYFVRGTDSVQNVGEPAIYTWEIGNVFSLPHYLLWDPEIPKKAKKESFPLHYSPCRRFSNFCQKTSTLVNSA